MGPALDGGGMAAFGGSASSRPHPKGQNSVISLSWGHSRRRGPIGTNPNVSDPFFAYGIFRRGEIAFPRIAPYVDTVIEGAVEGTLEERDGVHLLVLGIGAKVPGDLIEFDK